VYAIIIVGVHYVHDKPHMSNSIDCNAQIAA